MEYQGEKKATTKAYIQLKRNGPKMKEDEETEALDKFRGGGW